MHSVWSRAAQAPASCHCRPCLHTSRAHARALARRAVGPMPKRKVTLADLFTACYSTILGTAALLDAAHKRETRRILDDELKRARAALRQLPASNPPDQSQGQGHRDQSAYNGDAAAPNDGSLSLGVGVPPTSKPKLQPTFVASRAGREAVRPLLEEFASLSNSKHRPLDQQQPWIQDQIDWACIEADIAFEEHDPSIVLRDPRTSAHLADITATVKDLVDELLRQAEAQPSPRPRDASQTRRPTEDAVVRELESLRYSLEYPSYQLPLLDREYTTHIRALLNTSIRRIFNQRTTSREMVARICYNLLTAGAPPTIDTYNALIAGFNRIERRDLAQIVVDSYLYRTTWPATAQTVVCLLNHYRGPRGQSGLRDVNLRMRGMREHGLHLANFREGGFAHNRLYERLKYADRPPGHWGKARRNDATFDYLIRAWLYHNEVGTACMAFIACLRSGAFIPIHTLQELLRGSMATAHFANARKLLVGIVKNFEKFGWYLSEIIAISSPAAVRELLRRLQEFLDTCWYPFGEIFGQTYKQYAQAAITVKLMISYLNMRIEVQETEQLNSELSAILGSSSPLLTRLELSISSLDANAAGRRSSVVAKSSYARVANIVSIEWRHNDLEEKTRAIVAACKVASVRVRTGLDMDPRSILLSKPSDSRSFVTYALALHRALRYVDINDHSAMEDISSHLFHRIPNPNLVRLLEENDNWKNLDIEVLVYLFGPEVASTRTHETVKTNSPYWRLQQQFWAARDSCRALIFTHLRRLSQRRALYYYCTYSQIPFGTLLGLLYDDMANHFPGALQELPSWESLGQLEPEDESSLEIVKDFEDFGYRAAAQSG